MKASELISHLHDAALFNHRTDPDNEWLNGSATMLERYLALADE